VGGNLPPLIFEEVINMGNEERQKWEASKLAVQRIFTAGTPDNITVMSEPSLDKALHLGLTACQQLIKVGEYDSHSVINPKDARRIIRAITGDK